MFGINPYIKDHWAEKRNWKQLYMERLQLDDNWNNVCIRMPLAVALQTLFKIQITIMNAC
jgi:hypothetical protein